MFLSDDQVFVTNYLIEDKNILKIYLDNYCGIDNFIIIFKEDKSHLSLRLSDEYWLLNDFLSIQNKDYNFEFSYFICNETPNYLNELEVIFDRFSSK